MKPVDPRLLRYAGAARGFLVASALIGIAQTAVTIAFAWLLTDTLTGVIAGRDVTRSMVLLVVAALLRGILIAASDAAGSRAAAKTGAELRAALIAAVGTLGPGWLARRNQAELAVTAGHGLDALDAYFARYIPQLVLTVIATPVLLLVIWWQDWPSGLTATITLPLIPIFLILIGIATRTVQRRQWKTLQQLAARFADTVQGLSTLRLFGREWRAAARIEVTADEYRRETMKVLRFSFLSGFAMELLSSLAVALIAVAVGFRLLAGELPLEVGLFVLLLAPEVFLPIRQVGVQFHAAAEGVAATEDVFAVLDEAAAAGSSADGRHHAGPAPSVRAASALRVRDLRVRDLPPVTLTAEPGTITLIEGPSGAGKSSLFAALRGAEAFTGEARLGEADVRELDPADWLAWAGQTPGLLQGTIGANVALGSELSAVAVREALDAACADDLDAAQELGVQGAGLSGGQQQRVAVARALYRHAADPRRVLLLDEPSSALDPETEARLWASLRRIADAGATVLLISHRRSARAIADEVVTLRGDGDASTSSATQEAPAPEPVERPSPTWVPEPVEGASPTWVPEPVEGADASTSSATQSGSATQPGSATEPGSAPPPPAQARDILRLAQPSLRRFLPGLIWGVLSAAAAVSLLAVSGWLIVSASIVDSLVPLSIAVVGVRFFAVGRAVTRYLERLTGHDAALRQLAVTRASMVRRLIPLSPAGLGRTDRGQVLSALVDDVENLQNLPLRVVQPLAVAALVAVGAVAFTAFFSPAGALALAVCLLIAAVVSIGAGWVFGSRAEAVVSSRRAELSASVVDYFGSLDVLVAYGAEAAARERVRAADAAVRAAVSRASVSQAVAAGVVSAVAGIASVVVLASAAPALATGGIDAPWLAVAVLLPMVVFEVFGAVPLAAASWRSVRASAERIAGVLPERMPEELRSDAGDDTPPASAALRLRGVRAAWPGGDDALRGVDLDLAPGERVLVSGPSGAGKSTLAAALVGFLRAEGEYTVGGADAAALSGPALRRTVGLCEQSPQLFDEDIRQNLLFARDTATDADLLAVLDRVGLGEWARARGGLDARVGDRGALVSGGQAQRLSLARALLRGFPVLVLDEPTAGVDAEASDALLADLLGAAGEQSVLLISHVDPPVGTVDRVVHLEGGRTR